MSLAAVLLCISPASLRPSVHPPRPETVFSSFLVSKVTNGRGKKPRAGGKGGDIRWKRGYWVEQGQGYQRLRAHTPELKYKRPRHYILRAAPIALAQMNPFHGVRKWLWPRHVLRGLTKSLESTFTAL